MKFLGKSWSKLSIFRLVAGIGFGVYGLMSQNYVFILLSAFLIVMSLFHWFGCSGTSCSSSDSSVSDSDTIVKDTTQEPTKQKSKK